MLPSQLNGSPKRASLFARPSSSQGNLSPHSRPKSAIITPSNGLESARGHLRNTSVSQLSPTFSPGGTRERSNSAKNSPSSGTFAPRFIKSEELRRGADQIRGIEGENDFSGNKYVWLRDPEHAFIRGLVLEELEGDRLLVQSDNGDVGNPCTAEGRINKVTDQYSSNERSMQTRWTK